LDSLDKIHESRFVKSIHLSKPNEYKNGKQIHTVYTYLGGDVHLHIRKTKTKPHERVSRAFQRKSSIHPKASSSISPTSATNGPGGRDEKKKKL